MVQRVGVSAAGGFPKSGMRTGRNAMSQKRDMGHPDGQPAQPWRFQGAGCGRSVSEVVADAVYQECEDAYAGDSFAEGLSAGCCRRGLQLFTALQRLGVPSKMLYFPDEGHWVLKPQNSQLWYETVGDWCDRWTKTGRYAVERCGIMLRGETLGKLSQSDNAGIR